MYVDVLVLTFSSDSIAVCLHLSLTSPVPQSGVNCFSLYLHLRLQNV